EALSKIAYEDYADQRVVVKGCGDIYVPESAFVTFTVALSKVAKSIMYGEPCSTDPVYKRKSYTIDILICHSLYEKSIHRCCTVLRKYLSDLRTDLALPSQSRL